MTAYPAGPFVLKIPMVVAGLTHTITLNCDTIGAAVPGTDPFSITMRNKGGDGIILDAAVDLFWTAIRDLFGTDALASTYALWKTNDLNSELEFISAGSLTPPNGLVGVYVPAQQCTWTWRSGAGNIAKLALIETTLTGNTRVPLTSITTGPIPAVNNYVLSADNILMARDRSFPVAAMNFSQGQNEKVFEKRFRS